MLYITSLVLISGSLYLLTIFLTLYGVVSGPFQGRDIRADTWVKWGVIQAKTWRKSTLGRRTPRARAWDSNALANLRNSKETSMSTGEGRKREQDGSPDRSWCQQGAMVRGVYLVLSRWRIISGRILWSDLRKLPLWQWEKDDLCKNDVGLTGYSQGKKTYLDFYTLYCTQK